MAATKTSQRWAFRVVGNADRLVREAAAAREQSLTEFVVSAATNEAERVLADRTRFALDDEQWSRFGELLERPPRENTGLERLFARPDVFE